MFLKIDLSSKRAKLALRFFLYGVMFVATIASTAGLMFYAMGYRLNNNLKFYQGGLVQFNSFPNGADVYVDGLKQNLQTPGDSNLTSGSHNIRMSLRGYDDWSKDVTLAPGQLLWLSYARLNPDNIVTISDSHQYDQLASSLASDDRRLILLQPNLSQPDFVLVDISDSSQLKFIDLVLPDSILTKTNNQYGSFTPVEWDSSSKYVLLKEQNGSVVSFIRLNISDPSKSINLSSLFGFNIVESHFTQSNPDQIFVNTGGVLRKLDIGNNSSSDVLVNGLEQFKVIGDGRVAYVGTQQIFTNGSAADKRVIGIWENNTNTLVRSLSHGELVNLAFSSYENHDYLAIAGSTSIVDILRDPASSSSTDGTNVFAQLDLGVVPKFESFSSSGRMLLIQNNNTFATYDFEIAKPYNKQVVGLGQSGILSWLDDFYLWSDTGGELHVMEFDGTNRHDITSVQINQAATLGSDGKNLFSIGKNVGSGQSHIQISPLVVGR